MFLKFRYFPVLLHIVLKNCYKNVIKKKSLGRKSFFIIIIIGIEIATYLEDSKYTKA